MTTFCVAYKNEKTIEWAGRTGNMAGGWVRNSAFVDLFTAKEIARKLQPNMSNSAIGVFASHDNDPIAWYDRNPRYMWNRHILVANAPISMALGGLINARESDWF